MNAEYCRQMIEEQKRLEAGMYDHARSRMDKEAADFSKRSDWSSSKIGRRFVKSIVTASTTGDKFSLVDSIATHLGQVSKGRPGQGNAAIKALHDTGINPETLAYLTTKTILNHTVFLRRGSQPPIKRASLCSRIGDAIHAEWRIRWFANTDKRKALLDKLEKDFDRRAYPKDWRERTIRNYFDSEKLSWTGWTAAGKAQVGLVLLDLYIQCTGLVKQSDNGQYIVPNEGMSAAIEGAMSHPEIFMVYAPMVVPPIPWSSTNLFRGGYLTSNVRQYPLIKRTNRKDVDRLLALDLSQVIRAVNAMQETAWRINKRTLEAVKWAYHEYGQGVGKLPASSPKPLPPLPPRYREDPEVKKKHNRVVFEVHDANRRSKSTRLAALLCLTMSEKYSTYPAIFFPHNLDSRGRAYSMAVFPNPQGADFEKAMLEFADGVAIETPSAHDWLAISGANAFGNDKVSLEERVAWVKANTSMIQSIADDYTTDHRWMEASEPFQFLRFCFEWSDLCRHTGPGPFMSHMVVPVDATCSGLQHYSALLRDEVGGKAVNLIPGLPRQDVYQDVANVVIGLLKADGSTIARNLLRFGIDRKTTKRQVMTVPYAAKFSSCMGYTRKAIEDRLADGEAPCWTTDEHDEHVVVLSRAIWTAIGMVVVKAREGMQYLSGIASDWSKKMNKRADLVGYDKRMTWLTPDGFEVAHYCEAYASYRVETHLEGRMRTMIWEGTGKLNVKDMALAVAPNFIHALDATHLRKTINRALDIGITSFAMIHDSFGAHAANMGRFLSDCVRPAFVDMYSTDVLAEFADTFKDVCDISEEAPVKGKLDLEGVLRSEFFFS